MSVEKFATFRFSFINDFGKICFEDCIKHMSKPKITYLDDVTLHLTSAKTNVFEEAPSHSSRALTEQLVTIFGEK